MAVEEEFVKVVVWRRMWLKVVDGDDVVNSWGYITIQLTWKMKFSLLLVLPVPVRFSVNFKEVIDFINGAIMTLDAFVEMYKPAAISFSLPIELMVISIYLLCLEDCMIHCFHL